MLSVLLFTCQDSTHSIIIFSAKIGYKGLRNISNFHDIELLITYNTLLTDLIILSFQVLKLGINFSFPGGSVILFVLRFWDI
jgi:hypothetical protein